MLQTMRDLAKSWIFKGLMMLLVVSFGIWGIGDMFRGNPAQREVAKVGKVSIPVQALEFRFQAELPEARKVFGPDLTAEQARQIGVLDRTLSVMMEQASFDQEARRLGIEVSDMAVLRRLAALPQFRDEKGKFRTELWQEALRRSGMSERSFLDHEKQEAARRLILTAVTAGVHTPQAMIDNLYQARGSKRILEVVTLSHASVKDIPAPDQAALEGYYQAHEEDFVAPEYRGLTVARLSSQGLAGEVKVTDDDLQKAYAARSAELTRPETRDLVQVVFPEEEAAKQFVGSIKPGASLADVAKAKGLDAVTLAQIDEKAVLPELYASVFTAEEGQTTPPLKSALGWHVVQVKKIHASGKPSFDQVKEELRRQLQEEKLGDLVSRTVNQLDDALAGGTALEEIAESMKLHMVRWSAVDSKGLSPDSKEIKDMPARDLLLPAAFGLSANETSQVIDDGKGDYYVVRVDQVTPSQTRPLAEVKDKVTLAWLADQQALKAAQMVEDMAKSLREGKAATSFAARPGVEVRLSKPISLLGDMDRDVPPTALHQVFMMKKGDVITASGAGKQYAIRLADIVPVDPKKPEASRVKVVDDLRDSMPMDLVDQYAAHLHKVFPQKINKSLMDDLKSRGAEQ